MSLNILLKFAIVDPLDPTKNTIEEHMKILNEKGAVWWGKFGRGMADSKYKTLKSQIDTSILTYAFLYQGLIPRYKAKMVDIHKQAGGASVEAPCPEPELAPSYYRDKPQTVWFKFDEFVALEDNFNIKKDYERENGEDVSLAGQSALLFIKSKMPDRENDNLEKILEGKPMPMLISEILDHVYSWITNQGFILSKSDLINFHCCLRTKPFVILAGISGTGKTKFVRLFAEAVGATDENKRFQIIPVRPDWNDNSELLGFFDLNGRYQPGALIPLLLRAHANQDRPYFLCLDEMNLARVEHYFSDFLSVVESRRFKDHKGKRKISTDIVLSHEQMHQMNTDALDEKIISALDELKDSFPNGLGLPENLYVIGTVNMDETTHPFSRKVLDRASTIEFSGIKLTSGLIIPDSAKEYKLLNLKNDLFCPLYLTMIDLLKVDTDVSKDISEKLQDLNATLAKAGCEVGYRIRDEAAFYMKYIKEINSAELDTKAGFERVILQKILPRLQGSSYQVKEVLENILGKYEPNSRELSFDDDEYTLKMQNLIQDARPLVKKLGNMLIQFREEGFTSFWSN